MLSHKTLYCLFWLGLLFAPCVDVVIAQEVNEVRDGKKPNILFISVDDLNDWIGCMGGHPQAKTPNIDRLAAQGMLFTNAHCSSPSCNPSRTAILTGIPCYKSGVYDNRQRMRYLMPRHEIIPKTFSNHGYWSAGSGKLLHYFIDAQSWDDYFPKKETENPFPRTLYPEDRPVSIPRAGAWQYIETDWGPLDVSDEEFGGDWLVSEWIGDQLGRKHEKPFFLACGIYRPHEPWFVPKRYFDLFPLDEIQLPPGYREDDLDDLPQAAQKRARNRYFDHIRSHDQWKPAIQGYLASIAFADAMVGRVLDALEKGPNRDNTIIVLWSDHGWHLGEKEHWQKFTAWRACSRVPLIFKVPEGLAGSFPAGTVAGQQCDRPVSLVSLFSTLAELSGIEGEVGSGEPSLVPLLSEPNSEWPHAAITHMGRPRNYSVSGNQFRYIHYDNGDEELYDIKADPYEWKNLASDPKFASTIESLRQQGPKEFAKFVPAKITSDLEPLKWNPFVGKLPGAYPIGDPFDVFFHNQTKQPFNIVRLDANQNRHEYGTLEAGWFKPYQARNGEVWLVENKDSETIGYFVIGEDSARASIPSELDDK